MAPSGYDEAPPTPTPANSYAKAQAESRRGAISACTQPPAYGDTLGVPHSQSLAISRRTWVRRALGLVKWDCEDYSAQSTLPCLYPAEMTRLVGERKAGVNATLIPISHNDFYDLLACRALERHFWRNCGLGRDSMYGVDVPGSQPTQT
jgi:hypothetical protein